MKRPNILYITSDQQHYSTLGSTNAKIRTPALDRLASEGARFDRAYCCNPLCTPSRASMITGQYPSQHGAWTIGVKLPEDVPTLGQHLRTAGYESTLVGKAHFQPLASVPGSESVECQPCLRDLDFWRRFNDQRTPWYGFDRVELGRMHTNESHVGQHYAIWMEEKGLKNWRDYFDPWPMPAGYQRRENPARWDLPEEYHYNTWISERIIANIERCATAGRPFFSWASFFDPHYPQIVPDPWYGMYDPAEMEVGTLAEGELERMPPPVRMTQAERPDFSAWQETEHSNHGYRSHQRTLDSAWLRRLQAVYYGMVSFTDKHVGLILDALDRLGIADNTLVVYTSDHGDYLGQHGLHAKGAFHYEDGIRVPLLARWPGKIAAGQAREDIQSLVDVAPTFMEAAGLGVPGEMTGLSRVANWTRGDDARQWALVENRHQPTKVQLRTYVTSDVKITVYRGEAYGELFDLRSDPQERKNLWDEPSARGLKARMLEVAVQAEMAREPMRMPRVAGA